MESTPTFARAPALVPTLGLLLGVAGAAHLDVSPLAVVGLLAVLALTLRRRAGYFVAAAAVGWIVGAVHGRPSEELQRLIEAGRLDLERPVEVLAVTTGYLTTGYLTTGEDEALLRVRSVSIGQGEEVFAVAVELRTVLPHEAEPQALGTRLRLRGYLRRSPGLANDPRLASGSGGPGPWRLHLKSVAFFTVEEPAGRIATAALALRRGIEARLDGASSLADPHGARTLALVRALTLGDRSRLPLAWQQALRRCGLAHLLAVSGLHVGVAATLLALVATPLPRRARILAAGAGVLVYLLLVGPVPSVLRATWMGVLAAAALWVERPPEGLNALACCAALLLVQDPGLLGDLGFCLSVAATAGILVLGPALFARLTRLPYWLRTSLAVTLAATVATLPWTLVLSRGVHPLSPLLNLVAVPWLALFLLAAVAWLGLGWIGGSIAALLLAVLQGLAWLIAGLATLPPSPAFLLSTGETTELLRWTPAVVLLVLWRPRWAVRGAVVAAALLLTGAGIPVDARREPLPPELVLFDVGQGDALLLRDGAEAVLVDGGGWPSGDLGGRVLAPALFAAGVDRLRAVLATHPDRDHCGGLVDVVRYVPVDEVWMGPGWRDEPCASELLTSPGPRWRVLWQGDRVEVGRWRLTVLQPEPGSARHGVNDRSLVVMAEAAGRRVLLTGDVEAAAESRLVRTFTEALRADVLKVAHHGSKTSTTADFLAAVLPAYALISVGSTNPYGHPHPKVVERLSGAGVRALRTDTVGMVRLSFPVSGPIRVELPGRGRLTPWSG